MQNLLKLYLFFLADFTGIHYNSMISGLKYIYFFTRDIPLGIENMTSEKD